MRRTIQAMLCLSLIISLSGCIPAMVTAGATTAGVTAAQERSAGNAMDDVGIRLTLNNLYFNQDINDLFKNVDIRVSEGRVLLTGSVDKPETKVDAVRLAWRAKGVREVIDEIQVNDKTGLMDYARDTWMATQIRSRLLFEKGVRSINYNVEVVNGVVYLLGIAQDEQELRKVTYLASTTKYVKQVISHVVLKTDQRRRVSNESGGNDSNPPRSSSGQPESQQH